MRRILALQALVLGSLLSAGTIRSEEPPRSSGALVIVGGGTIPDDVVKRALELAGGEKARVLVIPQASEDPETPRLAAEFWTKAGAKSVAVLSLADAAAAEKSVAGADLIWIAGGDQNRLMKALENTRLPEAIRARHAAGAVLGGTSAGAAVMSATMITGDAELAGVTAGATKTAVGLGLWPGALVDQHFLSRQRFNRLLSAVLDHPDLVGVGIDEGTAVVVTKSAVQVFGKSSVLILDARRAKVAPAAHGEASSGSDLTLHILRAGMTWSFGEADQGKAR